MKKPIAFLSIVLCLSLAAFASADGVRQRIKFARGENSASVEGSVARGGRDIYIIGGREGQKMSVKISSDENNAVFQIRDAASKKFVSGAGEGDDATEWSNAIPATGDYEIIIGGARGGASYKLSVTIK
ncbi:MAG: hypothetical protein ACR2GD_02355 [Pyrinomonadaceae bacterium]